ncbi:hypothetical protein [Lactococcus petauri]|uniref:hypothetical protein n=1 Tax=Lactococcus petauri TaxID=1940789 RepID=UPI0018AAEAF7|nr:hypothetical protein [Lactococcus petauri]MDC0825450.1 hypothetical protein [Lactococcus petauri]
MEQAEKWAINNLEAFKHRMRISATDENEIDNLNLMLATSYISILRLVGVKDASDLEVKELIFERARYVYNDALDEFEGNYRKNIYYLWLAHKPNEEEEVDSDKISEI